ncbi:IS5 family transposase [Mesorhizobium sp. M0977]|uniref:IS5 family transposase n=1 Tax=Mesorhizobium sp. M0977 TaxID=2957039 RepID=UPI00333D89F8
MTFHKLIWRKAFLALHRGARADGPFCMLWANRRLSWLNAILRGTFAAALVFFGTITVQAQRADGIFWVLRSGAPCRDLPGGDTAHAPRATIASFDGGKAGVWDRLMHGITKAHDATVQMIDTSIVRVHQQGATAKRGIDYCLGRSRCALTTKIHALVDAEGRPIKLTLTAGQMSDIAYAADLIKDLPEGAMLLADKGYDANALRNAVTEQKAWANIPPKANRKDPMCFSPFLYKARNLVERSSTRPSSSVASQLDMTSWQKTTLLP